MFILCVASYWAWPENRAYIFLRRFILSQQNVNLVIKKAELHFCDVDDVTLGPSEICHSKIDKTFHVVNFAPVE